MVYPSPFTDKLMSKGVHNIAFYVSPDPECSRTTQNSEISLAPSRGRILYAIYGNSTCVINHIVVTAIDKKYRNYYVSTGLWARVVVIARWPCSRMIVVVRGHCDHRVVVSHSGSGARGLCRAGAMCTRRRCSAVTPNGHRHSRTGILIPVVVVWGRGRGERGRWGCT